MQKSNKNNKLVIRILMGILTCLLWTTTQAASPLWVIVPAPGSNPTQTVPENGTTTVQYMVQNQSAKPKKLVIQAMPGIAQTSLCQLAPKGQAGSTCTLNLFIRGNALPKDGIHGGPVLCQSNSDGSPNPNQCYQPSSPNILHISKVTAAGAQITVAPTVLNFVAGSNGIVTLTNNITSAEPAFDVVATILGGSNISVQSTTCGASLAIGANCTITFTAPSAEGPTNINISGSNTNTANVVVTVTSAPIASLSISPITLQFTANSTGNITVTNSVSSPVAAENVVATIPGGSNISVQSTTCGASLAIGANCIITFTSSIQEGPTTIPVAGDNTNTANVDVTVDSQPQISITSPILQNRIVTVSSLTSLSLEITNDAGSIVNADAITVSNKALCPNLSVDSSNCMSVAPGASCTLELTSNTPYAPCTITINGSNTNSPQTLIAFSYLGGLVFQESGGSGKVVIDEGSGTSNQWASAFTHISGATDPNNGEANTNAIIANGGCLPGTSCAARICRDIGLEWYLPASNELLSVHNALCSNATIPCNFGGFFSGAYWNSTQVSQFSAGVLFFPFGNSSDDAKMQIHNIRCIQTFP